MDQFAVRKAVDFRANSYSDDPKSSKIPLAQFSMASTISKGFHDRIFSEADVILPIAYKPFCEFHDPFTTAVPCD